MQAVGEPDRGSKTDIGTGTNRRTWRIGSRAATVTISVVCVLPPIVQAHDPSGIRGTFEMPVSFPLILGASVVIGTLGGLVAITRRLPFRDSTLQIDHSLV